MNLDDQLKLQAWLDGELPEDEAAAMSDRVARDPEARALMTELQNTATALKDFEAGVKLPESREFFWSKIEREIERSSRAEPAPERPLSWMAWLLRYVAPVGAAAALMLAMLIGGGKSVAQAGELEVNSNEMGAYTYRDQQERITVVWFYDRGPETQFTPVAALASVGE